MQPGRSASAARQTGSVARALLAQIGTNGESTDENAEAPSIEAGMIAAQAMRGCSRDMVSQCYSQAAALSYPNTLPAEDSATPAVTGRDPEDTGVATGTTGTSESDGDDDTGDASSSNSSSGGDCSAATQDDVFLETTGTEEDNQYQAVDDWGACCAVCRDDSDCMAWCAGLLGGRLQLGRRCWGRLHPCCYCQRAC